MMDGIVIIHVGFLSAHFPRHTQVRGKWSRKETQKPHTVFYLVGYQARFREGKAKENLESRQNLFKLQRRKSDNSFPIEPGVERDTLLKIEI